MRDALLDRCRQGQISPQIALAQMVIGGVMPDGEVLARLARHELPDSPVRALADLATTHRDQLRVLQDVAASGIDPVGDDPVAATAALYDRLVAVAPEAAVAFYSLGDPTLLDRATAELVSVIRSWATVPGADVLDLGCGIGRVTLALADEANSVLGLDVSAGMVAEAARRGAGHTNVRFAVGNGRDLAGVGDASIDLLIAADSFPYVVGAGLAGAYVAEAARVLRPAGVMLVFNWSYRGDVAADVAEARALAEAHGLTLDRAGERPFRIWDGTGFRLNRASA
ncbi:class I SAM-dependent methyltransferase [Sphingomonas aerophila]|uniref:SAM-dependent methyltransferase n=1 Tax=Sphingomonas aerophila TaxID=1344948 RepID=A0A7W9BE31_9SPHN|nr:class I SAM-dependent methyltransferase [Sphingomonas aerophila]MBB5715554.1 SAM-dependent methyltransferase [Sphingomonas aerophila]